MKLKLAIFSNSLAGGGAERVISHLLEVLKANYDITLVLMEDDIIFNIPKDIKIFFLDKVNYNEKGIVKLFKLVYLGWKYKQFCKNNVDISLAFMNRPTYISILAKLFGSTSQTIISERSTPSMLYQGNSLLSKVNRFLIKNLYPKADLIIANSEGNRLDLINHFDIPKNTISMIPNLFNLSKIKKLSKMTVDNLSFDKFTYITVGRLDAGKNHKFMIKAFSMIKNSQTQLIILGVGEERSNLEKYIISLSLESRVFLLGFDNNPYKYLAKSNVFVFSSIYEGFPNVLVEALACGLPVISTDCRSGPREILVPTPTGKTNFQLESGIEISKYGILVGLETSTDLKKAMQMMHEDKKLYYHYKNIVCQRALDFEIEKIIKLWTKQIEMINTLDYNRR